MITVTWTPRRRWTATPHLANDSIRTYMYPFIFFALFLCPRGYFFLTTIKSSLVFDTICKKKTGIIISNIWWKKFTGVTRYLRWVGCGFQNFTANYEHPTQQPTYAFNTRLEINHTKWASPPAVTPSFHSFVSTQTCHIIGCRQHTGQKDQSGWRNGRKRDG